jgi:hypothetical protein
MEILIHELTTGMPDLAESVRVVFRLIAAMLWARWSAMSASARAGRRPGRFGLPAICGVMTWLILAIISRIEITRANDGA